MKFIITVIHILQQVQELMYQREDFGFVDNWRSQIFSQMLDAKHLSQSLQHTRKRNKEAAIRESLRQKMAPLLR